MWKWKPPLLRIPNCRGFSLWIALPDVTVMVDWVYIKKKFHDLLFIALPDTNVIADWAYKNKKQQVPCLLLIALPDITVMIDWAHKK